jgi:Leucine rich repeat
MWCRKFFSRSLISALVILLHYSTDTVNSVATPKNITLECWNYSVDLMCKAQQNLTLGASYEVNNVKSEKLSASELQKATTVVISHYRNLMELIPKKIGLFFPQLEQFISNAVGVKSIEKVNFLNMTKVKLLNLADNQITVIHFNTFSELKSLESLNLQGNKIIKFHLAMLKETTNLKVFNAANNKLTKIESDLFNDNGERVLKKLESIILRGNELHTIETNFSQLPALQLVDLSRNTDLCRRCSIYNKHASKKIYENCGNEEFNAQKKNDEIHQECVMKSLKNNTKIAGDFVNCTKGWNNKSAMIMEKFNNCTLFDKKEPSKNVLGYSKCLLDRMKADLDKRKKFRDCTSKLVLGDLEAEILLKNCTEVRDANDIKIQNNLADCRFCPIEIDAKTAQKCTLNFDKRLMSIEDFQRNVTDLFGSDDYFEPSIVTNE